MVLLVKHKDQTDTSSFIRIDNDNGVGMTVGIMGSTGVMATGPMTTEGLPLDGRLLERQRAHDDTAVT